jgi:hypothetical protein
VLGISQQKARGGFIMDIYEFLNNSELPLKRPDNQEKTDDFEEFLSQALSKYMKDLCALESSHKIENEDDLCQRIKGFFPFVEKLCAGIRSSVKEHLNGKPYYAYQRLKETLNERGIKDGILGLCENKADYRLPARSINPLDYLYRIRHRTKTEPHANYFLKDIFHIPFQLRHQVSAQRFSIPGIPCLYLGGSLHVCWEELGRPHFHDLHVSRFSVVKEDVKILDFGGTFWNPERVVIERGQLDKITFSKQLLSSLLCWPLIAASTIKVLRPQKPFIPEYIIPQMLLQWIVDEGDICDGIRYFSSKTGSYVQTPCERRDYLANFVFPTRHRQECGYCETLQSTFRLTHPVAWPLILQDEKRACGVTEYSEIQFGYGQESMPYTSTDFGKIEGALAKHKNYLLVCSCKDHPQTPKGNRLSAPPPPNTDHLHPGRKRTPPQKIYAECKIKESESNNSKNIGN